MRKRVIDVALVLITAPLWLPLLLAVGVLVRFRLGSPVLFRQSRAGKHGKPFTLIKFRTMLDAVDRNGKALPDADRLTPFGRALRASSLDELPEMLNVLRGEMSLVGPRPLLLDYLPLYSKEQARRHEVLPGVSGWAQVNGRNAQTWEERLKLDAWYVDHQSIALDLRIIALTVLRVFQRQGIEADGEATMARFTGTS